MGYDTSDEDAEDDAVDTIISGPKNRRTSFPVLTPATGSHYVPNTNITHPWVPPQNFVWTTNAAPASYLAASSLLSSAREGKAS